MAEGPMPGMPVDEHENYELAIPRDERTNADKCTTTLNMLTWNIGGKKPLGTGTNNFPNIRTAIAPIIKQLLEKTVDVFFFQELSSGANLSRVRDRWGFKDLTPLVTRKKKKETKIKEKETKIKISFEAGVSSPKSERLEVSECNLEGDILKGLLFTKEFIDRTHGRLITIKDTKNGLKYSSEIMFISYHAQHKCKTKTLKIIDFFREMCEVAEKQKKTIIIGGDFNHHILDWKDDVEKEYEGRVIVALYVASPRRWDADIIDTFVIVHPENDQDRTLCTFEKTTTIYCFPLVGYIGGEQTKLKDYPPSGNTWFKYLHYTERDKDTIAEELKTKVEQDKKMLAAKKESKSAKAKTGATAAEKDPAGTIGAAEKDSVSGAEQAQQPESNIVQSESDSQEESSEYIARTTSEKEPVDEKNMMDELSKSIQEKLVISQPYLPTLDGIEQPPPALLWPRSSLHCVFDHDPVLTTLTCTLKLNESTPHASAATRSATPP